MRTKEPRPVPALSLEEPAAETRPFLKWAGGKRQLLPTILSLLPREIQTYHEPFLGGGAVFFALASRRLFEHACLSDLNARLITTFRAVRDVPLEVLQHLRSFRDTEARFYAARTELNRPENHACAPLRVARDPRVAALMIFINKTGFNGLYRENASGLINTPYGHNPRHWKQVTIVDEEAILRASGVLYGTQLRAWSYERALCTTRKGDFVYLDPPYMPLRAKAFTRYTREDFTDEAQEALSNACRDLHRRGVRFLLSNSDMPAIRKLYAGFEIIPVHANRRINSKANGRGAVGEVLIRNYSLKENP
jgi:DNA adenine methylase